MAGDAQSAGRASSTLDAVERIFEEGDIHEAAEMPLEYRYLDERLKLQEIQLNREYAGQEIRLRENYAKGLLLILGVQIAVADVVFCLFATVGEHWHLSDGVIQIWLAAAVVEVIGVVAVVTRHLFPRRDGDGAPGGRLIPTSARHDTVRR